MPKRKRRDRTSEPEVGRRAASSTRRSRCSRSATRRSSNARRPSSAPRRQRRKKEAEHQELIAAKDDAVARVKALRRRDRVAAGETAEADAAYKAALAALIEFETGAPPPWAPPASRPRRRRPRPRPRPF